MSSDTNNLEKVEKEIQSGKFMIVVVETNDNYGLANEAWEKLLKPMGFEYESEIEWGLGGRCESTYIHVPRLRKARATKL